MKKISFIIPVYNISSYIEKCIDSIIKQNDCCIEVLLVNDGSTDNVLEVLDKYLKKYDYIKILNKENGGLSSARNYGLKHVTGDYIWFVDGDDYIEPDSLSILRKIVDEKDYDIVSFNYYCDYDGSKKSMIESHTDSLSNSRILVNTSPCTKIFNSSFFKKNKFLFDEGIIYEDLALIPYIMGITENILFINDKLYNYVYRNNSIMNSRKEFSVKRDNKFVAIENLFNRFKNKGLYDNFFEELEFLLIRHLLIVYSTEIVIYKKDIYLSRCDRVNKYLMDVDSNWKKNKYLHDYGLFKRLYVSFFSHRFYFSCKFMVFVLRKVGRI